MTYPRREPLRAGQWPDDEAAERRLHSAHGNGDRAHAQPSLGELFSDLSRETQTLINQELQLARLELKENVAGVGRSAAQMAIGGAIAYAGFIGLMLAAIYALSQVVEPWLAALITGLVVAAVGALLLFSGYNALKQLDLTPRRTVATIQENAQWLKRELS